MDSYSTHRLKTLNIQDKVPTVYESFNQVGNDKWLFIELQVIEIWKNFKN